MRNVALRRPGRRLPVLLLVLGALGALATPAHAHDVLVASEPAEGSVLEVPPSQVVLTFSAEQMPLGNAFQVTDPDGTDRVVGDAVVDGRDLRQELDGLGAAGEWTVEWRSVASDGHPVSGAFAFTVTTGAAPVGDDADDADGRADGGAADGTADGSLGTEATGAEATEADPTAGPGAESSEETGTDGTDGGPSAVLVAALAIGAVAAAAVVWALLRRLGPKGPDEP